MVENVSHRECSAAICRTYDNVQTDTKRGINKRISDLSPTYNTNEELNQIAYMTVTYLK